MKKLIYSIVAVLFAFCLTLGIAGCSDFPMPDELSEAAATIRYDNFEDFKEFYNRKFVKTNKEKFYLLNPGEDIIDKVFTTYEIVGDTLNDYIFTNPTVYESFAIYNEELGDSSGEEILIGSIGKYSFIVDAEFYAVSKKISIEELTFEFNSLKNSFTIKNGEEVIGICYFGTKLNISQDWFEMYLKKNLI